MNLRFEATASVRSKSLFASTVEGFAIGLVLAIVACAGSSPPVATRSSPSPIEDCRGATETGPNPPTLSPGVEFRKMTVDSKLRDYRLFRPPQLDPTKPVSLVVVLHGSPIDAAGFEDVIHFDQEATSDGFVTASPNGCGGFWSYTEGGSKVADEDFIRKVIADVMAEFQVSKVFAMGASGGSRVAYRLACDFADVITGMASVSGTMVLQDACSPTRPVSVLEIHGTKDAWEGGGDHGAYPVEAVNQRWRDIDGCAGDPVVKQTGSTISSVWSRCIAGAVVRLDKVIGGGHTWFVSNPITAEPDANKVIGNFFSSLPGIRPFLAGYAIGRAFRGSSMKEIP